MNLEPCPKRLNCVSTQARCWLYKMTPVPYQGSSRRVMDALRGILEARADATITDQSEHHLRAEFRTRVFRFIDDATFVIDDETNELHFRAAARLGLYDFGNNRRRMRRIRRALARALSEPDRVAEGKRAPA